MVLHNLHLKSVSASALSEVFPFINSLYSLQMLLKSSWGDREPFPCYFREISHECSDTCDLKEWRQPEPQFPD